MIASLQSDQHQARGGRFSSSLNEDWPCGMAWRKRRKPASFRFVPSFFEHERTGMKALLLFGDAGDRHWYSSFVGLLRLLS